MQPTASLQTNHPSSTTDGDINWNDTMEGITGDYTIETVASILSSALSSSSTLTSAAATESTSIERNNTPANIRSPNSHCQKSTKKSTIKKEKSTTKFGKQVQSVKEILRTGTLKLLKTLDKPQARRQYLA